MLQTLSIRNFVIVESLDLEFEAGYSVLTGETGAGKSILIDALSLTLGARGESGVVRAGCERAEISANFSIVHLTAAKQWLTDYEMPDDDGQLLLRRVMYADGRTRAFINGATATVQQLRELGELLVDIYSQHAHHSLLKAQQQRNILDEYAACEPLAKQVAEHFHVWQALHLRQVQAEQHAAAYAEELAELRDAVRELKQLAFTLEDWEALQQEHSRLSHGASLLSGSEACRHFISEGEYAALGQLTHAQQQLAELCDFDPQLKESLDTLDSAIIQLQEADRFLNRYIQRAELDPERLRAVESQIQAVHDTARKWKLRPEGIPEQLQQWQSRMDALVQDSDDGALVQQVQAAEVEYRKLAETLSQQRVAAAEKLGAQISNEMQRLSLSGGQFAVSLQPQAPAATGLESVEFMVAGHAGVLPKPLAKVASGGELSRISLAIRVVTAQRGDVPTMIFDEVDVGIGGGVAEVVGGLLKTLGKTRQVLVITHLPQVASLGERHYQVSKSQQDGLTRSSIKLLDEQERIEEISRMLGGLELTEATRNHAREMLGL